MTALNRILENVRDRINRETFTAVRQFSASKAGGMAETRLAH